MEEEEGIDENDDSMIPDPLPPNQPFDNTNVDKNDDSMIPDLLPPNQPFDNTNAQRHHGNHKISRALKNLLPYNRPGLKEN